MKSTRRRRAYRMTARAEAAEHTVRAILDATVALWRERSIGRLTLDAIAERAGVSARTVIRRFGSRDGVIEACIRGDAAGVREERARAPVGDIAGAIDALLTHYERDGDAVLRTLAVESEFEAARAIVAAGRREHRAWCARIFASYLPPSGDAARAIRLDAFVAATDIYIWKLLRRDLRRTRAATARSICALLDGLVQSPAS